MNLLNEKNFANALLKMNFTAQGNVYAKNFADNIIMRADLKSKKLFYPAQIKNHDRNNFFDESHRENLVVFECVNRLLDKGYNAQDIWLEKNWQLGHSQKSGRADICVSQNGKTLFIIECKTAGAEFNRELNNMRSDGGQLFSYWQQEQSCQWLMLYASDFDGELKFEAKSIKCDKNIYRDAHTVEERFKVWAEHCDKKFYDDVIFYDETIAYKIGVKPLRKCDLKDFIEIKSIVNKFEEILRHNQVSNKANAFDVLIALFICKLVDETMTDDKTEVSFQFKDLSDTSYTFQDRLQKLYRDGMEKFMKEPITYVPLSRVDELLKQIGKVSRAELSVAFKDDYRKLKFFNNNAFAFIDVHNEKLFNLNSKVLVEVVDMLQNYFIIGSKDLHTLGILFEQLLNKGFKQDEGQFFTPIPIAHFIWDSLPLDEIISNEPPKIIDYACGAGHFLTEGFQAVNDYFARKNLPKPPLWERDRLFGVEKDDRLARVSKISLFMHGANEGKIKFGDGLENYPDENISPATFDILVANPPYSVKGFKSHLKLANELEVLKNISNDGSEIETLFVERINQLIKPRGVAAVILPSSILNKDGKSFVAARESLLKNFYIRAIVQLGSKTFGATGTNTVILFLQKIFDPPERAQLLKDSAEIILQDEIQTGDEEETIFANYLKKINMSIGDYRKLISNAQKKTLDTEREKIIYFGLTYRQTTLIISAPDTNDEQEKFLGYGWSNAKGREGMIEKKIGGLLFDNDNRAAENTLAAVIRAAFIGEQIKIPALEEYYHYSTLADMLDFDSNKFTKTITLANPNYAPIEYSGDFETVKLGDVAPFVTERTTIDEINLADFVTTDNMLKDKRGIKFYDGEPQISALTKFLAGDVLISNIRPYLKKIWLADRAGGCSPDVLVFRSRDEKILLSEYLFEILKQDDFFAFAMATSKGMKMPRGDKDKIQTYKLPLPPVDVQKKIVAEFDSIAAQIAQAEENIQSLDAAIKNKFAELFVGKNFPRERLDNIADEIIQGTSPKSEFYNDKCEGLAFYQGKKDFGEQYLKPPTMWTTDAIKISIKDDILMSVRAPVGDVNLNPFNEICIGRGLAAIRFKELATRKYIFYWLYFHNDEISGHKGATFDSISGNELRAIKIPLPPLELQEEFAAYVTNCEAMKKSARTRLEELKSEREELVRKYFR